MIMRDSMSPKGLPGSQHTWLYTLETLWCRSVPECSGLISSFLPACLTPLLLQTPWHWQQAHKKLWLVLHELPQKNPCWMSCTSKNFSHPKESVTIAITIAIITINISSPKHIAENSDPFQRKVALQFLGNYSGERKKSSKANYLVLDSCRLQA